MARATVRYQGVFQRQLRRQQQSRRKRCAMTMVSVPAMTVAAPAVAVALAVALAVELAVAGYAGTPWWDVQEKRLGETGVQDQTGQRQQLRRVAGA